MIQTKIVNLETFESQISAIESYFSTLNQNQYDLAAGLFSQQGQLIPPFESAVVGGQAIASYLKQEAIDMSFHPISETATVLTNGQTDVEVRGKVSTSTFTVNVVWNFLIAKSGSIDLVKVNLLASLKDLMHLNPKG